MFAYRAGVELVAPVPNPVTLIITFIGELE